MDTFLGSSSGAPCDGVVMGMASGKLARTTSHSGSTFIVVSCRTTSWLGGSLGGPGGSCGGRGGARGGGGGVSHM